MEYIIELVCKQIKIYKKINILAILCLAICYLFIIVFVGEVFINLSQMEETNDAFEDIYYYTSARKGDRIEKLDYLLGVNMPCDYAWKKKTL